LKFPRVDAVHALGLLLLLLLCGASTWLVSATSPVIPEIDVPGTIYANEAFIAIVRVTRDLTALPPVYSQATGHFVVDHGVPSTFDIPFGYAASWEGSFTLSLSSGSHTLDFSVDYALDEDWIDVQHASVERSIIVQTRLPSYTVEWLQKPDGSIRAGKMIQLRFSIRDASGSFVQSDDVRIVVEDAQHSMIAEAACGRRSSSIRINDNREYYRWYWKTEKDLPEGDYSVIVLLDGANLSDNYVTIAIVS